MRNENTSPAPIDAKEIFGERLFTTKQLALALQLKEATIREWITEGDLPAAKLGKQYLISETVLQNFKRAKEEEQAKRTEERRLERERKAELERRQQLEPSLAWGQSYCLGCGRVPVLTTRYMRLDGQVFCEQCMERETSVNLTKDGWKRKVMLQAMELNKIVEEKKKAIYRDDPEVLAPRVTRPFWLDDECGYCGKPFVLSQDNLRDPRFHPYCDHPKPFSDRLGITRMAFPTDMSVAMFAAAGEEERMRLAQREVWERNLLEEDFAPGWDEIWELSECAHCGEKRAVATLEHRKIGLTQCRTCVQRDTPVDPWRRAQIILRYLPNSYAARKCACGKWELVDSTAGDQVILSWCVTREEAELEQLARAYGQEWIVDKTVIRLLLSHLADMRSQLSDALSWWEGDEAGGADDSDDRSEGHQGQL